MRKWQVNDQEKNTINQNSIFSFGGHCSFLFKLGGGATGDHFGWSGPFYWTSTSRVFKVESWNRHPAGAGKCAAVYGVRCTGAINSWNERGTQSPVCKGLKWRPIVRTSSFHPNLPLAMPAIKIRSSKHEKMKLKLFFNLLSFLTD